MNYKMSFVNIVPSLWAVIYCFFTFPRLRVFAVLSYCPMIHEIYEDEVLNF